MVSNWVSVIFSYIFVQFADVILQIYNMRDKKAIKKTKYPPKCQFGGYKNQKLLMIYFYIII